MNQETKGTSENGQDVLSQESESQPVKPKRRSSIIRLKEKIFSMKI